jgi:hypothetical protein
MFRKTVGIEGRRVLSCLLGLALALPWTAPAVAAERTIDLDGDSSNGEESRIVTRVLQAYPVVVENVIHNNTTGQSYKFFWAGAGPGGFDSRVVSGPNVGTKWEWSTVSQVYSIQSPIEFDPEVRGIPTMGSSSAIIGFQNPADPAEFDVPGKSIFPSSVTVSAASLTSSLVTFFSPEHTLATCEGTFQPGRFEQTFTNESGATIVFEVEQQDCCPEPQMTICPDGCRSYLTDPDNCGGCGIGCESDETCEGGVCEPICPAGQDLCGESCVDLQHDDTNCGACGLACAFDEYCNGGVCEPICPAGQDLCGGACVDLQHDDANCGACGAACAFDEFCEFGSCAPICLPDETLCPDGCANLGNDPENCGSCGFGCGPLYRCADGTCEPDCPPGEVLCGELCVDLSGDELNCGACGTACAFDELCEAGTCEPICEEGFDLCGAECVDLQSDVGHCGACGAACGTDEVCEEGSCELRCGPGFTICGGECVDIDFNNINNCGRCGIACREGDVCSGGVCVPDCGPGLANCDGSCVDLVSDPSNCGACGNACEGDGAICYNSTCCDGELCGGRSASAGAASPGASRPTASLRTRTGRASSLSAGRASSYRARDPRTSVVEEGSSLAAGQVARGASGVVPATVCSLEPVTMVIPDGGSYTQCQSGALVGQERFFTATVRAGGKVIGQGPCALIVPAPEVDVQGFLPAAVSMSIVDESGDGLPQPGERVQIYMGVKNLGATGMNGPLATLSSAPDELNPSAIQLIHASSEFESFPPLPPGGDCETSVEAESRTNLTAFELVVPADQEPDVARVFQVSFSPGDGVGPTVEMPVVIGIGSSCDPGSEFDGETYDQLEGFFSPVNARLVPEGSTVEFSAGSFNRTKTLPLKFRLGCGSQTLDPAEIDPEPQIVRVTHGTLGEVSLQNINGADGANPDDPFFSCGSSRCEYQLRTRDLVPGDYVISVKMPDSRVFQAGFTIR